MAIVGITLRHLEMPLTVPYRLSYRTFEAFEPYFVEVHDDAGRSGFGDGHISPGSSSETREGGWAFLMETLPVLVGKSVEQAKARVAAVAETSKVAATAVMTALEMLEGSAILGFPEDTRFPLLTPVNSTGPEAVPAEVDALVASGFRTFKIKVGKDVAGDIARLGAIQRAAAGRATFRIDANRAYDADQAIRFVSGIDAAGVELFEQPCAAGDWDANAAVARRSPVPLMLDEPICSLADIDRAAGMDGVGYCKLKLKRFGSLAGLVEGLERVRAGGMEPVLGDGLGSEICAWMEAAAARTTVRNAGEFNGFLKARDRLFETPLAFADGTLVIHAGYVPRMDREALEKHTVRTAVFPD